MSACRNLEVAGSRGRGRPRMTWRARLDGDMKGIGLRPEMAMDREKWRCSIMGRTSDPHKRGNNGRAVVVAKIVVSSANKQKLSLKDVRH